MHKLFFFNTYRRTFLIFAITTLVLLATGRHIDAQPKKPVRYPPGKTIQRLPPGHRSVYDGRSKYYFYKGSFFVRKPSGYVCVRAPVGAVVVTIPIGARVLLIGGVTYYLYDDVYYRKVPQGYLIVEQPSNVAEVIQASPVVPSKSVVGESVLVNASTLNVRSGPGLHFPVVKQIHRHETLGIYGYAPEWLYVKMPGGTFGWVMLKYTTAHDPDASG